MKRIESSESAENNADHDDENPACGAGFGSFVIMHEATMLHQPAEGAFGHPAFGQHFESAHVVRVRFGQSKTHSLCKKQSLCEIMSAGGAGTRDFIFIPPRAMIYFTSDCFSQ